MATDQLRQWPRSRGRPHPVLTRTELDHVRGRRYPVARTTRAVRRHRLVQRHPSALSPRIPGTRRIRSRRQTKRPSGRSLRQESRTVTSAVTQYTTRLLTPDTWDDFAALVEANNGVWGGCWCIGFHPEGISKDSTAAGNREAKLTHLNNGTIHQMLVYRDGRCVGWCQYGPPAEVASIKNPKAYEKGLAELPDWRIGCLVTGPGARRT